MKTLLNIVLGLLLVMPVQAQNEPQFSRMIIFGDSLSDPGNVFVLTGTQTVPPYSSLDALLVPDAPYATGQHHFSNGKTWIEQLAQELQLVKDARSAFQVSGARNYALGGANAADTPRPNDLSDQVGLFLSTGGGALLNDALVVIVFGGNDVRDAIEKAVPPPFGPGDLFGALTDLAVAAATIAGHIQTLDGLGARNFLVGFSPNVARTPSIGILDSQAGGTGAVINLATFLSTQFNLALQAQLSGLVLNAGTAVVEFNLFSLIEAINADPVSVGLSDATQACVMPEIPPFQCTEVDDFLFWDGIHPTEAGHSVMKAQALADLVAAGLVE
jgi:outer membrane lipase/esterase